MFRGQDEPEERIIRLAERFRHLGATTPEKAVTPEELGIPRAGLRDPRLVRLGVFPDVNGRYYLSDERLAEFQKRRISSREMGDSRRSLLLLRMIRVGVGAILTGIFLVNVFVHSFEIRMISSVLLVALLAISILQIYHLSRIRRRVNLS